ncbi:unnamed protein product [Pleuronectes platessa]|uniref:Uncharacterized protein n=1 Tax=Pleuronectes platessa TaxID=8262 RepID=A0A9N7U829_PLEPL|nr:unnamed protein product [Pleuronectes platessa]
MLWVGEPPCADVRLHWPAIPHFLSDTSLPVPVSSTSHLNNMEDLMLPNRVLLSSSVISVIGCDSSSSPIASGVHSHHPGPQRPPEPIGRRRLPAAVTRPFDLDDTTRGQSANATSKVTARQNEAVGWYCLPYPAATEVNFSLLPSPGWTRRSQGGPPSLEVRVNGSSISSIRPFLYRWSLRVAGVSCDQSQLTVDGLMETTTGERRSDRSQRNHSCSRCDVRPLHGPHPAACGETASSTEPEGDSLAAF